MKSISELIPEEEMCIFGFVNNIKNTKYMLFLMVREETGEIQVSIDKTENSEVYTATEGLTRESTVTVWGKLVLNPHVKNGGKEFIPTKLEIETIANPLPIGEESGKSAQIEHRVLSMRFAKNHTAMKVTSAVEMAIYTYWSENEYTIIHTPKLLGTPSESGAELFELEYFGNKAYLAQSNQLYKQMAIQAGFKKFAEIGPSFRADNSNTNRHQTEFTTVDCEIAGPRNVEEVMAEQERLIKFVFASLMKQPKLCTQIKENFGVEIGTPIFTRITFTEAKEILKKIGVLEENAKDFSPEEERQICNYALEKFGAQFVFVTEYPISVRPFYHKRHSEKTTESYDLLYNGIEITTGAVREHRPEVLIKQIREKASELNSPNLEKSLESYIEFFNYGSVPHGGFGMGEARFVQQLLKVESIEDVVFLSRTPNRLYP